MQGRRNSSSLAASPLDEYGGANGGEPDMSRLANQYAQSKITMIPKYQNNARNRSTVDKDIQYSSVQHDPMLAQAIFNTENR